VPVITRQGWRRSGLPAAQPFPPDSIPADQPADLLIGDRRVGHDRQQLIQQGLAVLPGAPALGQRVPHLAQGFALPARDCLVEQLHNLIQHVGSRLGQHGQQDRVPPLRLPARQRLPAQPPSHGRQEPPSLGR
jgi:hypothetical protein